MLNLQRTTIFCVLFAAVWVQSTNAVPDEAKKEIEYLEISLNRVKNDKGSLPRRRIDHFKSWESWKDVKDSDRIRIARKYKELVEEEGLRVESGRNVKSMDKLAELACKALDEDVKLWIRLFEDDPGELRWMASEMKKVGEEGKFLECLAFARGPYWYLMGRRSTDSASSST